MEACAINDAMREKKNWVQSSQCCYSASNPWITSCSTFMYGTVILNKYGKQNEILWNLLGQFSQKMIARTISETNLWDRKKKKQCIAIYLAFTLEKWFGTIPLLLLSMVIDGESTSITHWFSHASVQDSDWNKSKKSDPTKTMHPIFYLIRFTESFNVDCFLRVYGSFRE